MASVTLQGVWLHDPNDPSGTVYHFRYNEDGAAETYDRETVFTQYAGRELPVVDFGESISQTLTINLDTLTEDGDLDAFRALVDRQVILCYRDAKGRLMYGSLGLASSTPITDTFYGATLQCVFTATDFDATVTAAAI